MFVFENSVEDADVSARVIESHIKKVDGRVLQVKGFLAAVPLYSILELLMDDVRRLAVVSVNLTTQHR